MDADSARDSLDSLLCVKTRAEFPESYTENSAEEKHLLFIADSFQRHFSLLYPDRKPLLLCPVNECGVQKLVSTTLRPTMPGLADLFTWQQCASFVSSYLTLQPLDEPTELPVTLRSPQTVLQSQRGSSLEYTSLLCSLLLGLNYNAYCVSGYASRQLCELDRTQEDPPLLDKPEKSAPLDPQEDNGKYNVKLEKRLQSNFLLKEQKKKRDQQQHSDPHQEPSSGPDPDPLWGLRVHFWVLVLAGSCSVEQNFFIEPLTGVSFPTDHRDFLGVESVWNELNLYVNMQDCHRGCQDLVWDPEDQTHWEPLVYGTTSRKQLKAAVLRRQERAQMGLHQDQDGEKAPAYIYNMPLSWCSMINITDRDVEMCWPGGFKETRYRQALVQNYIPFFCPDGVTTRLTLYRDQDCKEVEKVKEWFQNRADLLTEREVSDSFTTERFKPGRNGHLIFHRFNTSTPELCPPPLTSDPCVTPQREMRFGPYHTDGLVQRVECGDKMIEMFEKRRDFLFQRHTLFAELPSKSQASEHSEDCMEKRPILKVVEHFHRNKSIAASQDVAERVFLLVERRIEVTYHLEENHFIATKRSFDKPTDSTQTQKAGNFTQDMVTTFQVDSRASPLKLQHLYYILKELMKDEQKTIWQIRNSQRSVQSLILFRAEEEKDIKLDTSPWTTTGTSRARQHQERAMLMGDELRWLEQQQKDLLAPVLIRLNGSTILTQEQAQTVYRSCLEEFKSRMVLHARLMQQRYEQETQELEEKQHEFQAQSQSNDSSAVTKHRHFCTEKSLQIRVAHKRLQMHKECAPQKYTVLEQRLRADPRLGPHLKGI